MKQITGYNFSYPSSAAAVVFGVYLSAQAVFRLDGKVTSKRPMRVATKVSNKFNADVT